MSNGLIGLADAIHEQTGAEGTELEAITFYIAASFADCVGNKEAGDYFQSRLDDAKARLKGGV